jgi:acyl-CoA thioesterase-1
MRVQGLARVLAAILLAACLSDAARADAPVKLVAFGDSLTAGFGLAKNDAFPAKLERALSDKGVAVTIVNAGVSGDTTAGGLARIDWSIPDGTEAVIVELGANDALRGIDTDVTRKSLDGILRKLKDRNIPVLLCGMLAPPNLGREYFDAFANIYVDLAKRYDVLFYPFFLDGVAADHALNQHDGIHPSAAGVDQIVTRILPKVQELVAQVQAARAVPTKASER